MNRFFSRALLIPILGLSLASCAPLDAQQAPATSLPSSKFSRVLLVSGGPDARNNQYAIESNARYVASLTGTAKWRRILFADGESDSRTIVAVVDSPQTRAKLVVSWLWELGAPGEQTELRAPTLTPLDGAATPKSILSNVAEFGQFQTNTGFDLLYFTGHGSPGQAKDGGEDFQNTLYSGWRGDLSTRQLARALQESPSKAPLVLVMVQCHSGGFANALFQNADPKNPVWQRDFCGFFAALGERMSAGCTSQVNERNYQDFTTHFFAALSGVSRDGRKVSGADFDRNKRVSLLEAYAYAQIHDDSIDVPLCTSDAFLRSAFPAESARVSDVQKIPFSRLLNSATPWQRAVLSGLSSRLKLTGENRVTLAVKRLAQIDRQLEAHDLNSSEEWTLPAGLNRDEFNAAFSRLEDALKTRFPKSVNGSPNVKRRALRDASDFVATQTRDLNIVYRAYAQSVAVEDTGDVEEAQLLRFVRVANSIRLEELLTRQGTPAQKAIFARLRTSESRSAF